MYIASDLYIKTAWLHVLLLTDGYQDSENAMKTLAIGNFSCFLGNSPGVQVESETKIFVLEKKGHSVNYKIIFFGSQ